MEQRDQAYGITQEMNRRTKSEPRTGRVLVICGSVMILLELNIHATADKGMASHQPATAQSQALLHHLFIKQKHLYICILGREVPAISCQSPAQLRCKR